MWIFELEYMRNALVAALLIGTTAPAVGIYLVQRRLALLGDGFGHVALTGVGLGLLTGTAPIWTALLATVVGAIAVELLRTKGRTSSDVALSVIFYGGIAGGVVLVSVAPGDQATNLDSYLFGSIATTRGTDLIGFAVLAGVVLAVAIGLGRLLFTVGSDEEFARSAGLPVLALNLVLAVLVAVTVVVSMRVVGLLLVSALMILPVATAQRLRAGFAGTLSLSVVIGLVVSVGGVFGSYALNTPSGGTIVLFAIALFVLAALGGALLGRRRRAHAEAEEHLHRHGPSCGHSAVRHEDHVDYVHDGHRHAAHGAHYDEH